MRDLEFKDVLSALSHIRGGIPALKLSTRIRLGDHKSLYFGQGDFFDIKEFDPDVDMPNMKIDLDGDDDTEYARRCIEPRELRVKFLVDLSPSIYTGINNNRRRMLLEAIGFIGSTAVRYMDPVGIVGFTDKIVLNMPDKAGQNNFYYYLKTVYEVLQKNEITNKKKQTVSGTDYSLVFDFVRRYCNKPCFIPVISDFVNFEKVIDSPLLKSVASKHELIFIFLDDPLEFLSASGKGYVSMDDAESGARHVVRRKDLKALEGRIRKERKNLRIRLRKMGIQSVVLEYGEQGRHFNRLRRFFLARHKLQVR